VDAARIDGASGFGAFRRVVVPLLAPAHEVVGIYTFMEQWREFMWALIATSVTGMMTLPVGLSTFQSEFRTDYGLFMAGVAIAILPGALVFLLFQRWFLRGLRAGALRG
jgi:ABC-type glycerol-3-phosphate transport system permease component